MTRTLATVACIAALIGAVALVVSRSHVLAQHMGPPSPSIAMGPAGLDLPMDEYGGRPVVEVYINNKGPYRFILDTGATVSVVGEDLARELPSAGIAAFQPGGGSAPSMVRIDQLRVGGASLGGLLAAAMPLASFFNDQSAPVGVLSASSFAGYLVVFDYPGKRITVRSGSLPEADSHTIFQYSGDDALPKLPIRVAGHEIRVHLDTGSAYTLTLPRRFLQELPIKSPPRDSGNLRSPHGSAPVSAAPVEGTIEIGQYQLDLPEVRFADQTLGGVLGPGNIGFVVLRDFVVTLDSKNRRIRLQK